MGYTIGITRAARLHDSSKTPISRREWHRVAARDPQLVVDGEAVLWVGAGERAAFWWESGRIVAELPGPETIAKLTALAAALEANVVGDDGERYWPEANLGPPDQ